MDLIDRNIPHHFDLTGLHVGQRFLGCKRCWTRLNPGEAGGFCCGKRLDIFTVTSDDFPMESKGLTDDRSDPGLQKTRPDGQQEKYLVLSEEERKKGFVRPVRRSYRHLKCGTVTRMGVALAETYARQPDFYGATFCVGCCTHLPVGADGEFVWDGTEEKVGT